MLFRGASDLNLGPANEDAAHALNATANGADHLYHHVSGAMRRHQQRRHDRVHGNDTAPASLNASRHDSDHANPDDPSLTVRLVHGCFVLVNNQQLTN